MERKRLAPDAVGISYSFHKKTLPFERTMS